MSSSMVVLQVASVQLQGIGQVGLVGGARSTPEGHRGQHEVAPVGGVES